MTIDLRYVIPVAAFFAPTLVIKFLDVLWGSVLMPEIGFGLSLFFGVIAAIISAFFSDFEPIPFTIGDKRHD